MSAFIINLIGQPGAGKSVTRADLFCRLKRSGVKVEEVTEFAKDLVYEERHVAMRCQPYLAGKQLRNLERLQDKVDVIITDSPLILCSYYNQKYRKGVYPAAFDEMVIEQYRSMDSFTYFIERVKPYENFGRSQSEDESDEIGQELRDMLVDNDIPFTVLPGDESAAATIERHVLDILAPSDVNAEPVSEPEAEAAPPGFFKRLLSAIF